LKKRFHHIFLSRYGLLAMAVVVYLLSYLFNTPVAKDTSVGHERKQLSSYIQKHENDFLRLVQDTGLLRRLIQEEESLEEVKELIGKPYGFFLFAESISSQQMIFWNSQNIVPPPASYNSADGEYFYKLSNGYYVLVKKSFAIRGMSNKLWAAALIPVKYDYYINYEYLRPRFVYSHSAINKITITANKTGFPVTGLSGKALFYIDKKVNRAIPYNDTITIILRLIALAIFFVFAHFMAESVIKKHRSEWAGVATLVGILLAFRFAIYLFPYIFQFRQFELFDPTIFAGYMHSSLGDLLINSLLFSWISVYAWSRLGNKLDLLKRYEPVIRWIIGGISVLFLVLSTFVLADIIKSLVTDSKISFDVTNFFTLSKYTVIGFIILASLSLGYYHFTQLMFRFILPVFEGHRSLIYFGIAFIGLVYLTFKAANPAIQFYLPVLLWLVGYTWLVSQQGFVINRFRINIAGMLFWIFIFSVSISTVMIRENKVKEWNERKSMAEIIAVQNDENNETLLNMTMTYLDTNFFKSNFHRFYNEFDGQAFRDSIISSNYKGYQNIYSTILYVFDSTNNGIYNQDDISFESLNNIINVQSKQSKTVKGLYYYTGSYNNITYITKREVRNENGKLLGHVFILSKPKRYSTDALEATLFKETDQRDPTESPIYSFAIYQKGQLVESSAKYPFPTSLSKNQIPRQEVEKKENGDFDELWYRENSERVVVLARKRESLIEAITLFSYIFCSFLFLVSFMQVIVLLLKLSSGNKQVRELFQVNIRTQVHSTIIFISIFSFLIIGAATISFFIDRYKRNNTDKLSRTMKVMVNEMQKKLSEYNLFQPDSNFYDVTAHTELQKLVRDIADIHKVDVNVYDLNGDLKVTSQATVYAKGVLSKKINPEAYYHLSRLKEVERVQQENISKFSYLSIYAPVRGDDGRVYAYLNIPYFQSQLDLNQEISNFLVTIINLNAFIFLIAGVIALFITNSITRSFSIIGNKMKEINLGKMNETIEWNRNDEIGELVKEYNKMVNKLEESAAILAKSEREGAWREMARQVAHEIKNSLTPMKLSIQYLQKAILNNTADVKELTKKVANTLVEQIDHLSKIAFDFSQFANIGNTKTELFDLHDVLASLKELYQRGDEVKITWQRAEGKAMLLADKTQMNRLFTNLLQNAVEACHSKPNCRIQIVEKTSGDKITISVSDNGEGIPDYMQAKIFVPNFTTKSSGTGLGLAMCKSIVEQTKGEIWFETKQGEGTTFFIELPLAK